METTLKCSYGLSQPLFLAARLDTSSSYHGTESVEGSPAKSSASLAAETGVRSWITFGLSSDLLGTGRHATLSLSLIHI